MIDETVEKPWEPPQELMDKYIEAVKAAPDNLWQRWHDHEVGIVYNEQTISVGSGILRKIAPSLTTQQHLNILVKLRMILFNTENSQALENK